MKNKTIISLDNFEKYCASSNDDDTHFYARNCYEYAISQKYKQNIINYVKELEKHVAIDKLKIIKNKYKTHDANIQNLTANKKYFEQYQNMLGEDMSDWHKIDWDELQNLVDNDKD